jgi:hypothetical protein
MHNSKLVLTLSSLNIWEFKKFEEFVNSPFFNKNEKVKNLFIIIKPYYPDYNSDRMSAENVFAELFGDEPFDYWKIKNISSDLYKLAEEYLAYVNFKKNSYNPKKHLAEELLSRKLDKQFLSTIRSAENELQTLETKDTEYFYRLFELYKIKNTYLKNADESSPVITFQEQHDNFIIYFLLVMLDIYTDMSIDEKSFNIKFIKEQENEITGMASKFKKETLIDVYLSGLMLSRNNDEKYYHNLMEIKNTAAEKLSVPDRLKMYNALKNFAVTKNNEGIDTYRRDQFEILKEEFDIKLSFYAKISNESSFISHSHFLNFIDLGIEFMRKDELENFILVFKDKVHPEGKENTLNLSYARLHYYGKEYGKALEFLLKIKFDNWYYQQEVKNLTLMCYYSLNLWEELLSLLNSHKQFINKSRYIVDSAKKGDKLLVKYLERLVKIRIGFSRSSPDELRDEILKSGEFHTKEWLIEKTSELIQKNIK